MTLEGPEKIEISDEQLEALQSTYNYLTLEMEEMINDFFTPFDLMSNEGIFRGASADAYTEFCRLVHQYTKVRYDMVLEETRGAVKAFEVKINEIEDYND
jgi:hypothetical protein